MAHSQQDWKKPVRARHAYVTQALAEILEGLPKAAIALANHLFRICIAGKPEEIELYTLGVGEKRSHGAWVGKQYAKNTLLTALKLLEKLGIVQIIKKYGGGIFKLTVSHPGGECPFEQSTNRSKNLSKPTENLTGDRNLDQTEVSNIDSAVPSYRELSENTDRGCVEKELSTKNTEEIFNKYEERLKYCQITKMIHPESEPEKIPNPKIKEIFEAITKVSVRQAERGITTFLSQSERNEYKRPYAALRDAILKGWKPD